MLVKSVIDDQKMVAVPNTATKTRQTHVKSQLGKRSVWYNDTQGEKHVIESLVKIYHKSKSRHVFIIPCGTWFRKYERIL